MLILSDKSTAATRNTAKSRVHYDHYHCYAPQRRYSKSILYLTEPSSSSSSSSSPLDNIPRLKRPPIRPEQSISDERDPNNSVRNGDESNIRSGSGASADYSSNSHQNANSMDDLSKNIESTLLEIERHNYSNDRNKMKPIPFFKDSSDESNLMLGKDGEVGVSWKSNKYSLQKKEERLRKEANQIVNELMYSKQFESDESESESEPDEENESDDKNEHAQQPWRSGNKVQPKSTFPRDSAFRAADEDEDWLVEVPQQIDFVNGSFKKQLTEENAGEEREVSGPFRERGSDELERMDAQCRRDVLIAEAIRQRAKKMLWNGELEIARLLFKECVEIDGLNGKGWQEYAKLEGILRGGARRSLMVLKEAQDLFPEHQRNPFLWQSIGHLYQRLGSLRQARMCFKRGLELDPKHVGLYAAWGKVEAAEGNYDIARELFKTGVEADTSCARVYHSWAIMEYKRGDSEKSLELVEKGLELDSSNTFLWQAKGQVALDRKDYELARQCFENSLSGDRDHDDPPSSFAYDGYGRMEMSMGNVQHAKELFTEAALFHPRDTRFMQYLALFAFQEGRYLDAKQWMERAMRLSGRDSFILNALAVIEQKLGNIARSRALFKRSSEVAPFHRKVWDLWSWMEWEQGNLEVSERLLRKADSVRVHGQTRDWTSYCLLEEKIEQIEFDKLYLSKD